MSKKINVKPIETLTFEFEDGKTVDLKFSAYAMMILDDEFEGFSKLFETAKDKLFSNGAKLFYAGMKACNEEVTLDTAKQIVMKMNSADILEVFMFAQDTFGDYVDESKNPASMNLANRATRRAKK